MCLLFVFEELGLVLFRTTVAKERLLHLFVFGFHFQNQAFTMICFFWSVSEIVSVVSEKIETVIGTPSDSAATLDQVGCVIDVCQPALPPTHVQVITFDFSPVSE